VSDDVRPQPVSDERFSPSEVRGSMLAGIRWVAGARAVSETIGLASSVVLARLIAPPEFGRAVIALIVATLASILVTNAFASLLVQQETVDREEVRSAVGLNVAIGLLLSVLVFALAGPLASVSESGSPGLIRIVAPACLLAGLNAVPAAMLSRRLDFRRLSVIDVAALLVRVGVSVVLAVAGLDAYAIVIGAVASQMVATLAAVVASRPPLPAFHVSTVRRLLAFGAPNAASIMAFTAYQNIDYAVIGARLNPTQLALYYRAYTYGVDYQSKISAILTGMAFPVYSRLGHIDEVRAVRARLVRVHAAVIFPLLAGYAALAPTLIPWLLGERWRAVVEPSQYLVVGGAAAALLTGTGALMLAIGRPTVLMRWNIGQVACYGMTVYFAAPHGIVTVAAAVAVFHVLQCLSVSWFLLRGIVGIPVRDLLDELIGPLAGCAALVAAIVPSRLALSDLGLPSIVVLVGAGAVGASLYLVVMRLAFRGAWNDLALLAVRLVRRQRGPEIQPA
jgi:O-antigen/teichoic acid export membrane protein